LFDVRNQSRESLLLHLVVPEHEIAPGYAGYTVETTDGRTLSGIIVAETASGITLRQPLGVEETLLRERIARIDADDLSLMPQELEKSMTLQELADLLAWLKGGN
jgi:putative heme-binding domain-containing protein